jgi:hypothetical protein
MEEQQEWFAIQEMELLILSQYMKVSIFVMLSGKTSFQAEQ